MTEKHAKGPGQDPEDGDPSNRRGSDRCLTCHPAYVEQSEGGTDVALIHDLSISGAHLLTRAPIAAGTRLVLRLLVGEGAAEKNVPARVAWTGPRPPDRSDIWSFSVGVQFDAPMKELEPAIAELERRARPLRGS